MKDTTVDLEQELKAILIWGLRANIAREVATCNISSSSRNICVSNVGFCIETFEMIHTWSEWDTARPTIPGLRVPFAITERIEAARTMPLPRNSKFTPSHLHKMTLLYINTMSVNWNVFCRMPTTKGGKTGGALALHEHHFVPHLAVVECKRSSQVKSSPDCDIWFWV